MSKKIEKYSITKWKLNGNKIAALQTQGGYPEVNGTLLIWNVLTKQHFTATISTRVFRQSIGVLRRRAELLYTVTAPKVILLNQVTA